MDWTQGYVNQIDYTHGYYRELSPALIDFACLSAGSRHDRDWHATPFADVARELTVAKLEFAASAHLMHHLDGVGAPEKLESC
jgi:hypothetical protein